MSIPCHAHLPLAIGDPGEPAAVQFRQERANWSQQHTDKQNQIGNFQSTRGRSHSGRFTADELWPSSNRPVSVLASVGAAAPVTTNAEVCWHPVDDRCCVRHAMREVRRSWGCAQCPPFTMATVRRRGAAVFARAVTAGATECRVCGDGVVFQEPNHPLTSTIRWVGANENKQISPDADTGAITALATVAPAA